MRLGSKPRQARPLAAWSDAPDPLNIYAPAITAEFHLCDAPKRLKHPTLVALVESAEHAHPKHKRLPTLEGTTSELR